MIVAETILSQLGGLRFIAMTGAKNLAGDEKSLQFRLPRIAKDGITNVRITLEHDLYTVEFWSIRRAKSPVCVSKHEGVYADMLRALFTHETGLECTL